MEGLFYERVHALECEFAEKFKPLFEKVRYEMFLVSVQCYDNDRIAYSMELPLIKNGQKLVRKCCIIS